MRLFQGTREDFPYGSAVASVQIAIFAVFWSKTRGHCAKSRKSMVLNFRSSPIQGPILYQFFYAVREKRIVYYISGKHTSALSSDHRFEIFLRKYKTPSKNTRTAESRLLKRFISKLATLLCPASRFGNGCERFSIATKTVGRRYVMHIAFGHRPPFRRTMAFLHFIKEY